MKTPKTPMTRRDVSSRKLPAKDVKGKTTKKTRTKGVVKGKEKDEEEEKDVLFPSPSLSPFRSPSQEVLEEEEEEDDDDEGE